MSQLTECPRSACSCLIHAECQTTDLPRAAPHDRRSSQREQNLQTVSDFYHKALLPVRSSFDDYPERNMAQGAAKLKAGSKGAGSSGAKKKAAGKTAKGKRVIPPKDRQRVAEKAQQKVCLIFTIVRVADTLCRSFPALSITLLRSKWYQLRRRAS